MDRVDTGGGFSVLDGVALVMGSAIASIHGLRVIRADLTATGWVMLAMTFTGIAITATGPFLYLGRRFARKLPAYPKVGDRLWALLGVPWLLTAVIQSAAPGSEPREDAFFTLTLAIGLGLACVIALGVVWSTWVMVPPEQAARVAGSPWTNRVGLVLAIAWPIQCGLGLIVLN